MEISLDDLVTQLDFGDLSNLDPALDVTKSDLA